MKEWPLIGRSSELRRLAGLLAQDGSSGVVLAGPAGVGKTRLAMECLALAEQAGAATARATATHSASVVPFGALAALLALSDQLQPPDTTNPGELFRHLIAGLVSRAGARRFVLFVDDAHLLDEASATLIHRLVETRSAFVIAIVRSGEAAPDAVVALWKDGLLERIELAGLPTSDIHRLLETILDGPVDGAAAAFLAVRCEGNALFLRELILGALEDESLYNDEGIWRFRAQPLPSHRLVELVQSRLRALTPRERTVLECLAFAEPLGSLEMAEMLDSEAVEQLESQQLVKSLLDGRRLQIRLAHPIYGDVLRHGMPALRVSKFARSLADVIEGAGARRREDVLRVATWRLSGGGGSLELMISAAVAARRSYDLRLAERLARFAVQADGGFEAELLLAQLAGLQGRRSEADSRLVGLAATATDDDQRSRVALSRLDNAHVRLQSRAHQRIASEAEASIADPKLRDEISARRFWSFVLTEGPSAGAAMAGPLLERTSGRALVAAASAAAAAYCYLGRIQDALDVTVLAETTHRTLTSPLEWGPWMHIFFRSEALAIAGRLDEAETLATAEYEAALADGSPDARAFLALALARITAERGLMRTSVRFASESCALFRQIDQPLGVQRSLVLQALGLACAGQGRQASETLQRIEEIPKVDVSLETDILRARAWTAVANGDLPLARTLLEEAVGAGERVGNLVGAAAALHCLGRIGHAKSAHERLQDLTIEVEGALTLEQASHVSALAATDPSGLEDVSLRFEGLGAILLAAEAAADAASSWIRTGNPRQAAALQRRSSALVGRCEDAKTPALQSVQARARLTTAEREAAVLAAAGRSNRQIADELCVSVRTIESRLQHVYEKLCISGRDQLAEAL